MSDYQQGVPILITDTFRVQGVETNPTAIVYSILGPDGLTTTYNWPGDPEVTNTGVGVFQLALSPPALPGPYTYDVDATGAVVASRVGSFYVLPNYVTGPDVPWAVGGPCQPWTSPQAAWACCGSPMTTVDGDECPVDFSSQVLAASEVLFELSGRLYSGACEQTVRPCRMGCDCGIQVLSRGHVIGPWDFGWYWGNYSWMCGDDPCGCWPVSRVLLPGYPVREILEVKIDGDVVDPSTYVLQNWRWLQRMRDPAEPDTALQWPSCQAMDLPDTADGTFSVTYRYGQDVPVMGQNAAASLACEMYRACAGDGDCAIPANAVRVTRQGVTIDKGEMLGWIFTKRREQGWSTGLPLVDAFLNATNRFGNTQRPKTWSPDGNKFARKAGVSFGP